MASARRRIPAELTPERAAEVQQLALAAFRAVDCAGVARIDCLLDEASGRLYVNEINTLPGSVSFYLWEPTGLSFPALIDRLIELARARHRERRRTTYSYDSKLLEQFARGAKGKAPPQSGRPPGRAEETQRVG
jgi:D-alanine-D-alanine ligase